MSVDRIQDEEIRKVLSLQMELVTKTQANTKAVLECAKDLMEAVKDLKVQIAALEARIQTLEIRTGLDK